MGKPTVHDIAKEAGVSLATVDRVLNQRPGVRRVTVERVQAAIDKLGYVRDIYAANLARQRLYRLAFLLPTGQSQFLASLEDAVGEASRGLRAERNDLQTIRLPVDDPVAVRRGFERLISQGVDGVALMANATPMVRDMIARLKAEGVAVAAMVTDQPDTERDHFVGIDNVAAGRTAGALMGRFLAGRSGAVLVVVNSTQARDMVERRLGFDEVITREFPALRALPSLEGHDDFEETYRIVSKALKDRDDIIGVYSGGAGLRGVTRAIEEGDGRDLAMIGHELTPHSRKALEDGVVDVIITQNVGHIVRSAARVLRAHLDGIGVIASQELIRIEIVMKENLH
ncbi:MAG: LacI family DNA-binding transcriptional regulator [Pseudomonadota bacterium]